MVAYVDIVCVAIYGFNIAIVAGLLMLVGTRAVGVAIGGIALYTLLVGADAADVGFQLSFAVTAGLIWLTPPLERIAERCVSAFSSCSSSLW